VPFTEDQHPVGRHGPGGEHEPFGIGVRARAPGRDLHRFDADAGQDAVNCPARSRTRNRKSAARSPEVHQEVPDLLGAYAVLRGPRCRNAPGPPAVVSVHRFRAGGIREALRTQRTGGRPVRFG